MFLLIWCSQRQLSLPAVFGQCATLIINFFRKETGKNIFIVGARQTVLPYMSEDGEQSIYLSDRHLGCSILRNSDSSTEIVEFMSPCTVFPCARQTICKEGHTLIQVKEGWCQLDQGCFEGSTTEAVSSCPFLPGRSENAVAEIIPLVYILFQRFLHYLKLALLLPILSKNLILSRRMQARQALPFMWMLSCPRRTLHSAFSRHTLQAFCCTSIPTFMNIWLWFSPRMVSSLDSVPKGDHHNSVKFLGGLFVCLFEGFFLWENSLEFCTDLSSFLCLQLYQLHGVHFMKMAITLVYVPLFGIQCYTCLFGLRVIMLLGLKMCFHFHLERLYDSNSFLFIP